MEYIETISIYMLECNQKSFAEVPFIKPWNMIFAVLVLPPV